MSANILLCKASHKDEPRVKQWGRFSMVGKYYTVKSHGEGGKVGTFLQSTLMLICQFCIIRLHKENGGVTETRNYLQSEYN